MPGSLSEIGNIRDDEYDLYHGTLDMMKETGQEDGKRNDILRDWRYLV
jgi:hypothetical protein